MNLQASMGTDESEEDERVKVVENLHLRTDE